MGWFIAWAYLIVGEVTALLALTDEDPTVRVQWLADKSRWWRPYAAAALFVIAWPAVVTLLLLFPKKN